MDAELNEKFPGCMEGTDVLYVPLDNQVEAYCVTFGARSTTHASSYLKPDSRNSVCFQNTAVFSYPIPVLWINILCDIPQKECLTHVTRGVWCQYLV